MRLSVLLVTMSVGLAVPLLAAPRARADGGNPTPTPAATTATPRPFRTPPVLRDRIAVSGTKLDADFAQAWTKATVDVDDLAGICAVGALSGTCPLTGAEKTQLRSFCKLTKPSNVDSIETLEVPTAELIKRANVPACLQTNRSAFNIGSLLEGVNQTDILIGATDFLVKRAEGELRAWTLDQLTREVCKAGSGGKLGGKDLIPETCGLLGDPDTSILTGGIAATQKALRRDLRALPRHLGERAYAAAVTSDDQDAAAVVAVSGRMVEQMLSGASPVTALAAWARSAPPAGLDCQRTPVASALYGVSAILSVLPRRNGAVTIPTEKEAEFIPLAVIVNGADAKSWPTNCYVFQGDVPPAADFMSLRRVRMDPRLISAMASSIRVSLSDVEEALAALKAARDADHAKPDDVVAAYARVVDASTPLLSTALALAGDNVSTKARTAVDDVGTVAHALAVGDYSLLILDGRKIADDVGVSEKLPPTFTKIIAFSAEISQAKDAAAAEAALEAFASPPGAYRRKRTGTGTFYGDLNGYVGMFGGSEQVSGLHGSLAGGPTVQVGPELGTSIGKGWSVGGFVPLVDLGALAAWRANDRSDDKTTPSVPDIDFRHVFAPGAYVVVGFPHAPITFGVGASLMPRLRKISEPDQSTIRDPFLRPTENEKDAVRIGAFLAIDIPIFP